MTQQDRFDVVIRPMKSEDRDFIFSLTSRLEEVGRPRWRDQTKMHAFHLHYAEATTNASGANEAVFVADSDGGQLGVIHVMESKSGLTGEKQGYVATLAVTEQASGRGVGRALMDAAELWCRERGLRFIALDVFAQNSGARAFYERLGYIDETLTMIKDLT